ncbi:uncharacterized protein [Lepeophtheirus salmonis]|uniref:uncharacterized protein n=1 Tax=Lepeophtheirus salmonis TaxID=72036 RepID=UPI001AE9D23B|nr:uncharacterized protein LOC121121426 [Lepeophtheirus salmonis]
MENNLHVQVFVNGELVTTSFDDKAGLRSAPRKCIFILGVSHLFFCIISILIQTLLRFYHQSTGILDINNLGIGWYSGLIFGVTGGIGIYVSRHMTKCSLATFLVLCVLSSIMCLPLLLIAVIGYEQFKTAHASFITYLLPLQIVVSILEAIISIISSCISCHGTCCAHSPLVKPNCECKQISQNDKLV